MPICPNGICLQSPRLIRPGMWNSCGTTLVWLGPAVVLETKLVGKIQGLQIRGRMYRPVGEESAAAKKAYLLRFPYAAVMDPDMWVIAPDYLKLTDNRLGFGTKLLWEASPVKSDQTK